MLLPRLVDGETALVLRAQCALQGCLPLGTHSVCMSFPGLCGAFGHVDDVTVVTKLIGVRRTGQRPFRRYYLDVICQQLALKSLKHPIRATSG